MDPDEKGDDAAPVIEGNKLSTEEQRRFASALERMLELGMGAAYGVEGEGVPYAEVDCATHLIKCRAACCTFRFALTKEEVEARVIRYDPKRPYHIAREDDGYCTHLDRKTLGCSVWRWRPLRCRRYDCRGDQQVWPWDKV